MTARDLFMMAAGGAFVAAIMWAYNAIALELTRAEAVHLAAIARHHDRRQKP